VPFLLSLLGGFVSSVVIKAMLVRAVVALGISAVTYTGISIGFSSLVSHVQNNMAGLPSSVLNFLTMCSVPASLSVVLSAYTAAIALKGLTSVGAVTKLGISSAPGTVFSPGSF
jgi:hypothetical protein